MGAHTLRLHHKAFLTQGPSEVPRVAKQLAQSVMDCSRCYLMHCRL